jgi:peptide/nickel transport system permease protein
VSTAEPTVITFDEFGIAEKPPRIVRARKLLRQHPLGAFGLLLVIFVVFLAAFGPIIVPDSETISTDILLGPSGEHWFGTDRLGRDYLARVIAGARLSMSLALGAMAIGVGAALVWGMLSAYAQSTFDLLSQRVIDMMLAFPGLVLLLLLTQVIGRGWQSVALGMGIIFAVNMVRIVRASTLATLAESYVEAARLIGASPYRILWRHVLPNMGPPLLIYVTALLGGAILFEGALSFLGLGVPPPEPSWGRMLTEARTLWKYPHLSIFPGVAMTIAVLGFNLVGDSIRDIFDPRLRGA